MDRALDDTDTLIFPPRTLADDEREEACAESVLNAEREQRWVRNSQRIDIPTVSRRDAHDKVYFWASLVQHPDDVRMAALVYHVVAWTRRKRKVHPTPYTYDQTVLFADALGVSLRQFPRILKRAEDRGLLEHIRCRNKISIQVKDRKLYESKEPTKFYRRSLTKRMGVTESLIYARLKSHWDNLDSIDIANRDGGFRAGPSTFVHIYPWLTEAAVRRALLRLRDEGYVTWDHDHCMPGHARYLDPMRALLTEEDEENDKRERYIAECQERTCPNEPELDPEDESIKAKKSAARNGSSRCEMAVEGVRNVREMAVLGARNGSCIPIGSSTKGSSRLFT